MRPRTSMVLIGLGVLVLRVAGDPPGPSMCFSSNLQDKSCTTPGSCMNACAFHCSSSLNACNNCCLNFTGSQRTSCQYQCSLAWDPNATDPNEGTYTGFTDNCTGSELEATTCSNPGRCTNACALKCGDTNTIACRRCCAAFAHGPTNANTCRSHCPPPQDPDRRGL